jgi:hypothetical protein
METKNPERPPHESGMQRLERTPEQISLTGWFMGEAPQIRTDGGTSLATVRAQMINAQVLSDSNQALA